MLTKKGSKLTMKLKICGISDEENLKELVNLQEISYFGLIFAKSPRQVSLKQGVKLARIMRQNDKKPIGVFVDESDEFILQVAKEVGLFGVQIYKNIDENFYKNLKALGLKVWQVLSVGEKLEIPANLRADLVLFDTKGLAKGGNGTSFDWSLLENVKIPYALAGGIGLENMKEALQTKAEVLDINSKAEKAIGIKDKAYIQRLIELFNEREK